MTLDSDPVSVNLRVLMGGIILLPDVGLREGMTVPIESAQCLVHSRPAMDTVCVGCFSGTSSVLHLGPAADSGSDGPVHSSLGLFSSPTPNLVRTFVSH